MNNYYMLSKFDNFCMVDGIISISFVLRPLSNLFYIINNLINKIRLY